VVSTLTKLRWWELRQSWAQGLAVALVVACGVACLSGFAGTRRSLLAARNDYYRSERFGDVFAPLRRAPDRLAEVLASLPGVAELAVRVVAEGPLELPGVAAAVSARFVSLPDAGQPALNRVRLREGRMPAPGRRDEAVVGEALARARHLHAGDTLTAVLAGRRQTLRVVGVAISPEFVYLTRPGDMLPDEAHYGVVWLPRRTLAAALDLEGAFNDAVVQLTRDARPAVVMAELDRVLAPYGGQAALPRSEHPSARFLDNEIEQLAWMVRFLPAVFLSVSAFLLHIVMSRWVAARREVIATLKALGYADRTLALHHAGLVLWVVGAGVVLGALVGDWLGLRMNRLYANSYFHLPAIAFQRDWGALLVAALIALAAATVGAGRAVLAVVRLPPAAALQPEPPPGFRATGLERWWWSRRLGLDSRLVLRQLTRRPARALWTVLGVALGEALLVVGAFFQDAMSALLHRQFEFIERADATVLFEEPLGRDALRELRRLPGVLSAAGFRSVPVALAAGQRQIRTVLLGLPTPCELRRVVDRRRGVLDLGRGGLFIGEAVAKRLDVHAGQLIEVNVLEGRRPSLTLPVTDVVGEDLGTTAYLALPQLHSVMREDSRFSGAWLDLATTPPSPLDRALQARPGVIGVSHRSTALRTFEQTLTEYLLVFAAVLVIFAAVIDVGVLYNAGRIALAERQRDLATLRVLGMTHREVATIFLGEQLVLVLAALPVGIGLGYGLAWWSAQAMATELFRIPLVVTPRTVAFAAGITFTAALAVAWRMTRRVERLAMVDVLKARE
jgi:putative ABC transport system permease protein